MLSVSHLTKRFGDKLVLDDVSLTSAPNQILAVLGPSGGGKSTLLRCIARLETTEGGEINFSGQPVKEMGPADIGMVFQTWQLFPHLTVMENLLISFSKAQQTTAVFEKATSLLEQYGLLDKKNEYPGSLSGGQRQRVAITRALMLDPKILLFDEPTSALDPELVGEVGKLIAEMKSRDLVIVVCTHEMRLAKQIADKVVFIDKGKVVEESLASSFFSSPQTKRAQEFIQHMSF